MKTIRTYTNIGEADFAQSLLEASGIAATLDHESSALLVPAGIVSVRLQVPDEHVAEAEQILAEYPVTFSRTNDRSAVGFWKGGIYGLLAFGVILFAVFLSGRSWHVTGLSVFMIFFVSGVVGANLSPRSHS